MMSIRSVLRMTLTFTFDIVCAGGGVRYSTRRDSGHYVATLTLPEVVKFSVDQRNGTQPVAE